MGLRRIFHLLLIPFLLIQSPVPSAAYSVFTHELLIDLAWNDSLAPLLQARFPGISAADLQIAHSYAYGGCAIQDLGYYPLNREFFSDLAHYVRSGDFVSTLLRDAHDANEYAFALGAMAHYFGDNIGHHEGINRATAIGFPKLERKYGPNVTYDESPHGHVRTEFAFDVDQLSKAHMAPRKYLGLIGLRVPTRLLSHTFSEVYSLPLSKADGRGKYLVLTYRFAVRGFLPRLAYAQTLLHRGSFPPNAADEATQTFLETLHQAGFEAIWNGYRRKPAASTYIVAFLIRIIPKIGYFSDLAIKIPTPETQHLYLASVNHALASYRNALKQLLPSDGSPARILPNRDLDTGERTKPGSYARTDQTYAQLLSAVTAKSQQSIEAGLKNDILAFYADPAAPILTKKNAKEWARVQEHLARLRTMAITQKSAIAVE